jgi:hypothetical protein
MDKLLRVLVRAQYVDRRILYLLLALVIAAPIVVKVPVPPPQIQPETHRFYETIEAFAADPKRRDKLVILSANYGSGTMAENQTQITVVMRHLMKHRLKFAIFAYSTAQGREQGQLAADALSAQYDYVYGRDYVNWGFRPLDAVEALLKAAVRDVPGTFGNDARQTPLAEVPVMQGINTVNDIGMIIEVASSNTLPQWIQYFQRTGDEPIPTLYCPTSVMGPEAFPFLRSGQIQGMLLGLKGAIEYEYLTGMPGFGTQVSAPLSYSHGLIILMVILGNAGMFAQRHLERKAQRVKESE